MFPTSTYIIGGKQSTNLPRGLASEVPINGVRYWKNVAAVPIFFVLVKIYPYHIIHDVSSSRPITCTCM